MRSLCNYGIAIIAVCAICCATVRADVDLDTIEYNLELRGLREMRIEKFGGYCLGGKIKLPLKEDYDEQIGNSDWVDHGGVSFRYDEKRKFICMADSFRSSKSGRLIMRQTAVTPKTRLVQAVRLDFMEFSENIETLYASLQDEIVKAVGFKTPIPVLKKFMEDGKAVKVYNGKQLLVFYKDDESKDGIRYTILGAQVIDLRSVDAERAYVQAQKDKQQQELQRWIDDLNSRPPFTSFCGIEFGTRLTGDLDRTEDGRYLCGEVELDTPFRGCDTATVYASVKSRRIFRIEIETKDSVAILCGHSYPYPYNDDNVLAKRYKPNGNPLIKFDSYLAKFEGDKWREKVRLRKLLCDSGYSCEDYNLNGGKINVQSRKVGTGDFYNTVEKHGNYALAITKEREKEVGVLIATSYKYKKIADKEYEKESGGDGSGVL